MVAVMAEATMAEVMVAAMAEATMAAVVTGATTAAATGRMAAVVTGEATGRMAAVVMAGLIMPIWRTAAGDMAQRSTVVWRVMP
jgi:hypothetical protein